MFDFPNTPSVGDLFQDSSSGAVYRWNGYAWVGGVTGVGFFMPLQGVSDGSNASAGQIGEVISSNVTTNVNLTANTTTNITSILLTAGDWDVCGEVWVVPSVTGATTVVAALNTTSATLPAASSITTARAAVAPSSLSTGGDVFALRPCRASLTVATTYYLVAQINAQAGTATGNIMARRVR